jgi:hypothetical protein
MKKLTIALLLTVLAALVFGQSNGLVTDFTGPAVIPLTTRGDYVLRGTTLVQYTGKDKNVTVPDNLGITEIGEAAFGHASFESITLPAGLRKIAKNAFASCYYLTTVSIPGSITLIDEKAFANCSRLTAVNFQPARSVIIGNSAFESCSGLARVILPEGLSIIMDNAFSSCRNLVSVTIPDGVIAIGNGVFNYCEKLISVNMPANINYIGSEAIAGNFSAAYANSGKIAGRYNFSRGFNTWYTGSNPIPQAIPVTPGTPAAPQPSIQASFSAGSNENWYRITAPADGGTINAQTGGSLDTYIYLYDINGNQIDYDDDSGTNNNAMINTFVLEGVYYMKVRGSRGNYSLTVKIE